MQKCGNLCKNNMSMNFYDWLTAHGGTGSYSMQKQAGLGSMFGKAIDKITKHLVARPAKALFKLHTGGYGKAPAAVAFGTEGLAALGLLSDHYSTVNKRRHEFVHSNNIINALTEYGLNGFSPDKASEVAELLARLQLLRNKGEYTSTLESIADAPHTLQRGISDAMVSMGKSFRPEEPPNQEINLLKRVLQLQGQRMPVHVNNAPRMQGDMGIMDIAPDNPAYYPTF